MIESRMEDIGQALLEWFTPRVSSLGFVSFAWHPQMRSGPVYPPSPRTQCPRAYLRIGQAGYVPGRTLGCQEATVICQCSIWVELREMPGQQHQRLLVAALDVFQTALLQAEWRFEGLPVDNLVELKATSSEFRIADELDHPLDDPALRVSSGELTLILEGRLRS